jgi:fructokinase
VIAVCGEALVDLVPSDASGRVYEALPGGSPANTAVALSRLGVPTLMLARLSRDASGRLLREHLLSNGVDLSRAVSADEASSIALVRLAEDGSAEYRFLLEGTADWQWTADELSALPPSVVALHTGSLALARTPAVEDFLGRARSSATVSLDPNLRPSLIDDLDATRAAVQRWLGLADVLKASTEDLALLYPGEDPVDVARRWARSGPALVVITCAADGAFAVTGDTLVRRPARPAVVIDTVGAGDTFTAGLLEHLHTARRLGGRLPGLTTAELTAALDRGLQAAAVTVSRPGADPPWASEV